MGVVAREVARVLAREEVAREEVARVEVAKVILAPYPFLAMDEVTVW